MSNYNKDFYKNGENLRKEIDNVKTQYKLLYFVPKSQNVQSVDTGKCVVLPSSGDPTTAQLQPLDNNLHTEESCKLNAGLLQSEQSWKDFVANAGKGRGVRGLNFKVVQGYFNNNPQHFNSAQTLGTGVATRFSNIRQSTNGMVDPYWKRRHQYSVEWTGTFTPKGTGMWHLYTASDDGSFLWIGKDAIQNYNTSNAVVKNGGLHGVRWAWKGIHLEKGKPYPIRIQYGENWGGQTMHMHVHGPNERGQYAHWELGNLTTTDFNLQSSISYYSLVENTPELSEKGLYNCYVSTVSNNSNDILTNAPNAVGEEIVWSALDEETESDKIRPGNYAYGRNGALFICDENGTVLKQIGDTKDKPGMPYDMTWPEAVYYIYRYQLYYKGAGWNYSTWTNFAKKHYSNNKNFTYDPPYPWIYQLRNDGNIYINNKAITSINNEDAIENPKWKQEKRTKAIRNNLVAYDTTGTAPNWWRNWELKGTAIRRKSADNQTPIISDNGKFRLEMSESGNLVLIKGVKACTGKTETGIKYVTAADKSKNNSNYLYKTEADMKMDKLFIGQKNNNVGTLKRVNEAGNDLINGNTYMKYEDYAPTDTTDSTIVNNESECQAKCRNDRSCNYYYSYVTEDDAINCKTGTMTGVKQFIPIQPNSGIKSSDLYIRNSKMNLKEDDIRNAIIRENTTGYQSYSAYEVLPTMYNLSSDAIMSDAYVKLKNRQKQFVDGTKKTEGFEDHNYQTQNNMTPVTNTPSGNRLANEMIEQKINPMKAIAVDYTNKLDKMDKVYKHIGANVNAITNASKTGLRDEFERTPRSGYTLNDKDNRELGYLDEYNDVGPPMKKAIDVRLDDIDEMISQTNTIYSLGTVTAMTLIIASIFLMRN